MDSGLIDSLKAALDATPENTALRLALIKALADTQDYSEASKYIDGLAPESISDDEKILLANIHFKNQEHENGLKFLGSNDPGAMLLKARILSDLGNSREALRLYESAVEKNPALEDLALKARLGAKEVQGARGPKLRVIANDDTDKEEIARILHPEPEVVNFGDVGGLGYVKKQINKKIILPYQKPSLFSRFRKKVGGGILLYGPPGCGKTLLARATAGECNAQFFNVAISDILDMYIGESESRLHGVFEQARAQSPAVIFFDEVEALAAKRQHTREATSSKLVSQFLAELDGFAQNNEGVLVLAATNVPWALDPAFRRPGRFDRIIFVPPPDREARRDILSGLLRERPGGDSIEVDALAKITSGYSGADLVNLVETAVDEAIDETIASGEEVPLCSEHLFEAVKIARPTTQEWLSTARNYAKYANDSGQYTEVLEFLKKYGK